MAQIISGGGFIQRLDEAGEPVGERLAATGMSLPFDESQNVPWEPGERIVWPATTTLTFTGSWRCEPLWRWVWEHVYHGPMPSPVWRKVARRRRARQRSRR